MELLYHVSDNPNIGVFHPRPVAREDLDLPPAIWAIDSAHLPNYLLPRDCPRVCYRVCERTSGEEQAAFLSCRESPHVIAIERQWLERALQATLYLYTFHLDGFSLQDVEAGYYISHAETTPVGCQTVSDVLSEITTRNVELRILPHLWDLADAIQQTGFQWSLIRMRNALPRIE